MVEPATIQATQVMQDEHRCSHCYHWKKNWNLCPEQARPSRASRKLLFYTDLTVVLKDQQKDARDACSMIRSVHNEKVRAELDRRFGALILWWGEKIGGPYDEDHIAAVVLEFWNIPIKEVISILNKTLYHARSKPRSLRYFKVALEEGRGEYFKSQDTGRRRSGATNSELIDRIIARQKVQGGDS